MRRSSRAPFRGTSVHLWDAATGRQIREIDCKDDSVTFVFTPDGSRLFGGTMNWWKESSQRLRLWDVANGKEQILPPSLQPLPLGLRILWATAISPDGRLLALEHSGKNETVVVELATLQEVLRFSGHVDGGSAAAFSSDGRFLATGGGDSNVVLFDLTGRRSHDAQPVKFDPQRCWADLGAEPASVAFAAVQALACEPSQSVPFLRDRLKPIAPLDEVGQKKLRRCLAELNDDAFTVRSAAVQELQKLGELAEPALRQALENSPTPNAKRLLEQVLQELPGLTGDRLRQLRAVMALEYAGTAEARTLLRELSKGAPGALLTREAEKVKRLERGGSSVNP
jgi:hypothetical protein